MPFFNVGDKVYNRENLDKIYTVKKRTDITHCIPNYILIDEKGKELNNFWVNWLRLITPDAALRYGEILTDDDLYYELKGHVTISPIHKRIRTIRYDNRIFYHKMVNGEVVEFKELTT